MRYLVVFGKKSAYYDFHLKIHRQRRTRLAQRKQANFSEEF